VPDSHGPPPRPGLAGLPHLRIEQVISELAATRHRLHILSTIDNPDQEGVVTAVMPASYDALNPDTARAYRLLSLHTGPDFSVGAAAALLDTGADTAGRLIDALDGASLLTETAAGRWGYHDLTRGHAREMAGRTDSAAERQAAIGRVIEYYLRASAAADLLVLPGRWRIAPAYGLPRLNPPAYASAVEALAWADTEQACLVQAQATAARLGQHALAWQFADTLWGWLLLTRDHGIWARTCETALASADACGDPQARYMARIRLAALDRGNGRYLTARAHAGQALADAQTAGNRDAAASSCEHIGLTWLDDGDPATAATWFERGLTWYTMAGGNPRGEAIMRRHLARARTRLDDYPAATAHLHTALGIFTGLGDTYGQAATLADIAGLHLAEGSPADAIAAMEQALPLAGQAASPFLLARTLTLLADALSQAGHNDQARDRLARASQLHDELRLPDSHQDRARVREVAARLPIRDDQEPR
jgi:tetratricopeptide (TPR) repeat protein